MKVKEAYSKEFKNDGEEKILRESVEKDSFILKECVSYSGPHIYSTYVLLKNNHTIFFLSIPDPLTSSSIEKDFYLKYQNSVKYFLIELYEFLIGQDDTKNFLVRYTDEQKKDLDYKEDGDIIELTLGDIEVGFIDLGDKEKSKKLASNFINIFRGKALEYEWVEIK